MGYDHDANNPLEEAGVVYERARDHLPRDLGGFSGPDAHEYHSKNCEECGVSYTAARHSSRCLRCE